MATYDNLIADKAFVDSAAATLTALGEDVPTNPTDIVDAVMTEYRWGGLGTSDTPGNMLSALKHREKLGELDERGQQRVNYVASQIESMPDLFDDGGAPIASGVFDYVASAVTDPLSIGGMIIGSALGPAGSVAGRAAGQAASRSTASWLANSLRLAKNPAVQKAVAAESAITGGGAAYRSKIGQDTSIALGRKEELDRGDMFLAALAEGPGALAAGAAVGMAVRGTAKAIDAGATAVAPNLVETLKTQLLPKSARDPFAIELAERVQGETNQLENEAQMVAKSFDKALNKVYKTKEERLDANRLASSILESSPKSKTLAMTEAAEYKELVNQLHPELRPILFKAKNLIKRSQQLALSPPHLTDGFKKTIYGSGLDYARRVYEVFRVNKRAVPFKQFLKNNETVLDELESEILANPKLFQKQANLKDLDTVLDAGQFSGPLTPNALAAKQRAVVNIAEKIYTPKRGAYNLRGSLESRQKIPDVIKTLWGKDYNASQAITESVSGILRASEAARFSVDIADSLVGRGLAFGTKDAVAAARHFGVEIADVVPVFKGKNAILPNTKDILDPPDLYATRATASKLGPMVKFFDAETPLFANPSLHTASKVAAKIQGVLKIGKTVLSPVGMIRNMFSASLAFAGTGNSVSALRAIKELTPLLKRASNEERLALNRELSALGLTGQSIDLGQSLTRLGRDINETPGLVEKVGTFGLASLAPGIYKKALNFYGGTDDFSKVLTYVGELAHQKRAFQSMTPDQQAAQKAILEKGFGKKFTDVEYLARKAAMNTKSLMPVYSRVPLITESALTRSLPIIGNFSAYPSEIFRNAFNMYRLGTEELVDGFAMNNAPMITRALGRLHTMQALAASPYIIANSIAENEGVQEKLEALRGLVPHWDRYGALIITGQKEQAGKNVITYINASYSNPYQPIVEVLAPTLAAISAGESKQTIIEEGLVQSAKKFVSPYTDPALAAQAAQSLVELSFGDPQDPAKEFAKFYKTLEPGFVKFGRDAAQKLGAFKSSKAVLGTSLIPADLEAAFYPKAKGAKHRPPQSFKELGDIISRQGLNLGGMSERTVDVTASTAYTAQTLARNLKGNANQIKYKLRTMLTEPTALVEPGSDRAAQALKQVEDVIQQDYLFQHKFYNLYQDIVTITGSKKEAIKLLRDRDVRSSFPSKKALGAILGGNYIPNQVITKEFMKKFYASVGKQPPPVRAELTRNFQHMLKNIRELELEYRGKSLLDDPTEL